MHATFVGRSVLRLVMLFVDRTSYHNPRFGPENDTVTGDP